MPADHLPLCHTHFPVFTLPFTSSLELEWIACHGNNSPSLLLPISSFFLQMHLFEQKILQSILPFSFLPLHSCLISSLQWTWLFCFCNSQFDFSLIEDLINFSSGKCSADMEDAELEPLVMGFITLQYTYTYLISEAAVEPQYGKAWVFWCTQCIYPALLKYCSVQNCSLWIVAGWKWPLFAFNITVPTATQVGQQWDKKPVSETETVSKLT